MLELHYPMIQFSIIIIIAWWEKVEIIWPGSDIVNVSGVDVTPGDERFTITKNWIFG